MASLKKENHHYRQQIVRQNHLVVQIANTLELVFAEYRYEVEKFQRSDWSYSSGQMPQ